MKDKFFYEVHIEIVGGYRVYKNATEMFTSGG